jgi:hypothetical protein
MRIDPIIGAYEDRPATCHEYDPRSAEVAREVAALIEPHLPGAWVEHVGSTSVLGCAGKGVVDLMLLYPDEQLAAARDVLDALGFQRQTTRDPFPEDRPMRTGSLTHKGATFNLLVKPAVDLVEQSQVYPLKGEAKPMKFPDASGAAVNMLRIAVPPPITGPAGRSPAPRPTAAPVHRPGAG